MSEPSGQPPSRRTTADTEKKKNSFVSPTAATKQRGLRMSPSRGDSRSDGGSSVHSSRRSASLIQSAEDAEIFDQISSSTGVSVVVGKREKDTKSDANAATTSSFNPDNLVDGALHLMRSFSPVSDDDDNGGGESDLFFGGIIHCEQEEALDQQLPRANLDLRHNDNSFHVLASLLVEFFQAKVVGSTLLLLPEDRETVQRLLPKTAVWDFIDAVEYRLELTPLVAVSPIQFLALQCQELCLDCKEPMENPILVALSLKHDPITMQVLAILSETYFTSASKSRLIDDDEEEELDAKQAASSSANKDDDYLASLRQSCDGSENNSDGDFVVDMKIASSGSSSDGSAIKVASSRDIAEEMLAADNNDVIDPRSEDDVKDVPSEDDSMPSDHDDNEELEARQEDPQGAVQKHHDDDDEAQASETGEIVEDEEEEDIVLVYCSETEDVPDERDGEGEEIDLQTEDAVDENEVMHSETEEVVEESADDREEIEVQPSETEDVAEDNELEEIEVHPSETEDDGEEVAGNSYGEEEEIEVQRSETEDVVDESDDEGEDFEVQPSIPENALDEKPDEGGEVDVLSSETEETEEDAGGSAVEEIEVHPSETEDYGEGDEIKAHPLETKDVAKESEGEAEEIELYPSETEDVDEVDVEVEELAVQPSETEDMDEILSAVQPSVTDDVPEDGIDVQPSETEVAAEEDDNEQDVVPLETEDVTEDSDEVIEVQLTGTEQFVENDEADAIGDNLKAQAANGQEALDIHSSGTKENLVALVTHTSETEIEPICHGVTADEAQRQVVENVGVESPDLRPMRQPPEGKDERLSDSYSGARSGQLKNDCLDDNIVKKETVTDDLAKRMKEAVGSFFADLRSTVDAKVIALQDNLADAIVAKPEERHFKEEEVQDTLVDAIAPKPEERQFAEGELQDNLSGEIAAKPEGRHFEEEKEVQDTLVDSIVAKPDGRHFEKEEEIKVTPTFEAKPEGRYFEGEEDLTTEESSNVSTCRQSQGAGSLFTDLRSAVDAQVISLQDTLVDAIVTKPAEPSLKQEVTTESPVVAAGRQQVKGSFFGALVAGFRPSAVPEKDPVNPFLPVVNEVAPPVSEVVLRNVQSRAIERSAQLPPFDVSRYDTMDVIDTIAKQQLLVELKEAYNLMEQSITPETSHFWRDHVLSLQTRLDAIHVKRQAVTDTAPVHRDALETNVHGQQQLTAPTDFQGQQQHTAPINFQGQQQHTAPTDFQGQQKHIAPTYFQGQQLYTAPINFQGQQHHTAPTDFQGQQQHTAPTYFQGQQLRTAPTDFQVQQLHTEPTDFQGQQQHTTPTYFERQRQHTSPTDSQRQRQHTAPSDFHGQQQNTDPVVTVFQVASEVEERNQFAALPQRTNLESKQEGEKSQEFAPQLQQNQPEQQYFDVPMVDVVAPADLPGGYHFEAEIEGQRFLATVPPGGVQQGETFTCYMRELDSVAIDIPVGDWKDGQFNLFEFGWYHPALWCSVFCPLVALGQVQTRINLDFLGRPKFGDVPTSNRFMMLTVITFWALTNIGLFAACNLKWSRGLELSVADAFAFALINVAMFGFIVFVTQSTRSSLREKFMIREERCFDLEDICCAAACLPCTVGQMLRHTANYDDYEAVCCSKTGLPDGVRVNQDPSAAAAETSEGYNAV